jgi:hypothetical protein
VPTSDFDRLLLIYLDDHWAGAGAGLALLRRLADNNRDTPMAVRLDGLVREVETEERILQLVRDELDAGQGRLKRGMALAAERVGRFKLNGRLLGYSPLSRVLETEAMIASVSAKRCLWSALQQSRWLDRSSLAGVDFSELEERSGEQLETLRGIHREATAIAFGS